MAWHGKAWHGTGWHRLPWPAIPRGSPTAASLRLSAEMTWLGPSGARVTAAAATTGLSTRKVYKVNTLEWFLTGMVNPDVEFDIANRSGRSRAARSCREIL